jgi:hypothetical protein
MSRSYKQALAAEPSYVHDSNPIAESEHNFFDGHLEQLYGDSAILCDDSQTVAQEAGEVVAASELDEIAGFGFVSRKEVAASLIEEPVVAQSPKGVLRFDYSGRKVSAPAPAQPVRRERKKSETTEPKALRRAETRLELELKWGKAFDRVMQQFTNAAQKQRKVNQRYEPFGQSAPNMPTQSKASDSDYICDVTLAAKRALDAKQFALWSLMYVEHRLDPKRVQKVWKEKFQSIRLACGRLFLERRLSDVSFYFTGSYYTENTK